MQRSRSRRGSARASTARRHQRTQRFLQSRPKAKRAEQARNDGFHSDERRRENVFAMRLSVLGDYFVDAGDPPVNREGWQAALKKILPEPELSASPQTIRKEA